MLSNQTGRRLGRRAFLKQGSLVLLGTGLGSAKIFAEEPRPELRLGLITDLHYADKPSAGSRHYRETLTKLAEAAAGFETHRPEFVVELGDFIDAADSVDAEKNYLKRINREFEQLPGKKHYVLGNHCVYSLTKPEFLETVEREKSYYSFDARGFHFVVLDSCFRSDGTPYGRKNFQWTDANIPEKQLEWLKGDLKAARAKTVVFAHQRLDVENHYGVKNAKAVRKILEDSGKVLAVFQGHSHKNDYKEIGGIHYAVMVAMVEGAGPENNGYSVLDLSADGSIRVQGFRKQKSYGWK